MHLALFVGVVFACATVAMTEVGEQLPPTTTLAPTTSTAIADAPKLADTTKAPMTTVAPKLTETTTTTATTDTLKRWSRNPLSNTTTTEVPTTVIVTTIAPPTTTVVTTKVPATTTTDKLTPTTIDKPRYRRSEPVITAIIKPKELLPTKPESNETTPWFAATKSDDEWKNATFASERKHGENGTEEWEGADENRKEITVAIIDEFERTTILQQGGPATNETIIVIKEDEFVNIDAPKAEEKEKEDDTDTDDDDDDDDDDLPKGASVSI